MHMGEINYDDAMHDTVLQLARALIFRQIPMLLQPLLSLSAMSSVPGLQHERSTKSIPQTR
jgi:hypothetical protein